MQSVQEIAEEIIGREGGYVNDPDDPGGATNFGVTIHTMRRLGLDLTGDGKVTASDVKKLSKQQATDIFIKHYFDAPKISELPTELHATVFDMTVNAGTQGVIVLQSLLSKMGWILKADGKVGPRTVAAAQHGIVSAGWLLVDAYGIERRNYYYRLADRRKASRKYARRRDGGKGGWIMRAEAFISPRYHLSDEEHRQRTQKWA